MITNIPVAAPTIVGQSVPELGREAAVGPGVVEVLEAAVAVADVPPGQVQSA